jgi:hypothetical protein
MIENEIIFRCIKDGCDYAEDVEKQFKRQETTMKLQDELVINYNKDSIMYYEMYKQAEQQLQQSRDRERVLREALQKIGSYDDLRLLRV